MRRIVRGVPKVGRSEEVPECESSDVKCADSEPVRAGWMPSLRFVQSSPYSGETHVDGKSEVVHWVVKDRPFSIRVLEVASVYSEDDIIPEKDGESCESILKSDLAWSEVEVEAEVVYKANHSSVKPSTGLAPLQLDRSVIPPNIYNHRRSANQNDTGTDPESGLTRVLKLKQGAGLELLVRLSILSSHLRNDFCIHIKIFLRNNLIASWFSETIRSVSKWDKVSQKPVSASIPKDDHSSSSYMAVVDDDNNDKDITGMDDMIESSSHSPHHHPPPPPPPRSSRPSSSSASQSSKYLSKKKKASGEEVFEMLHQLKSNFNELQRLSHSPSSSKKRKASWHPSSHAYPTEEEAQRAAQEEIQSHHQNHPLSSSPSSSSSPIPSSPSSSSQASSLAAGNPITRFKKFKLTDHVTDEKHRVSLDSQQPLLPIPPSDPVSSLANHANQFLQLIDSMPPAEVRNALNSVILTRPELATALARLMKYDGVINKRSSCAVSCGQSIVQSSFNATSSTNAANGGMALNSDLVPNWPTEMMMPGSLSQSGQILNVQQNQSHSSELWSEERYEMGQEMVGGLDSESCHPEMPSVMSPYAMDDDSTTMGSPSSSYASWGDEWVSRPVSPFIDSSLTQSSRLTDSSLFPAHLDTHGF